MAHRCERGQCGIDGATVLPVKLFERAMGLYSLLKRVGRWRSKFKQRMKLLMKVAEQGSVRIIDLSRELGADYMSVYNDVTHLVQQNLLAREEDIITATGLGRRLASLMRSVLTSVSDRVGEDTIYDVLAEMASSPVSFAIFYSLRDSAKGERQLLEEVKGLVFGAGYSTSPTLIRRRLNLLKFVERSDGRFSLRDDAKLVVGALLSSWERTASESVVGLVGKEFEEARKKIGRIVRAPAEESGFAFALSRVPTPGKEEVPRSPARPVAVFATGRGFATTIRLERSGRVIEELEETALSLSRMCDRILRSLDRIKRFWRGVSSLNEGSLVKAMTELDAMDGALSSLKVIARRLQERITALKEGISSIRELERLILKLEGGSATPAEVLGMINLLKSCRGLLSEPVRMKAVDSIITFALSLRDEELKTSILSKLMESLPEDTAKLLMRKGFGGGAASEAGDSGDG